MRFDKADGEEAERENYEETRYGSRDIKILVLVGGN